MSSYVFHSGQLLDPRRDELVEGLEVLVEDDRIKEVALRPIKAAAATRVDLAGRTLMPGLIDAHVHAFLPEVNFALLEGMPITLLALKAAALLRAMLRRGFTTVRDVGGADLGMKMAIESGLVDGPRLFIAGRALTQTGGQGDVRRQNQTTGGDPLESGLFYWSRVVDGVPEMVKAVRDELRQGADHIKLMVSGGVLSRVGSLHHPQFSTAEIEAACREATRAGAYVCAHAYTGEAIARAVSAGVRTIEHGNLIDAPAADIVAQKGAFLVPTLAIFDAIGRRGEEFGIPELSRHKNEKVRDVGLQALQIALDAGVDIGFGTDLVGDLQTDQCHEFLLRAEVMRPIDIIRSATLVNARILRRERQLGEIVPGAMADLLVVEGNPLRDLGLFQNEGGHLSMIMKGGQVFKCTLPQR